VAAIRTSLAGTTSDFDPGAAEGRSQSSTTGIRSEYHSGTGKQFNFLQKPKQETEFLEKAVVSIKLAACFGTYACVALAPSTLHHPIHHGTNRTIDPRAHRRFRSYIQRSDDAIDGESLLNQKRLCL